MSELRKLQEEINSLTRELEKYKGIAAAYRAALGDCEANRILARHFHAEKQERNRVELCSRELAEAFRKAGLLKIKPMPIHTINAVFVDRQNP